MGVGIPPAERFADVRANALVIGPGLPTLDEDLFNSLPDEIRNDPVWTGSFDVGAYYHVAPEDQSTCNHLGTVMTRDSSVKNGRCNFYEPFGGTISWRVLDADGNILPQAGATYHVAVFLQDDTSSKLGIAVGTFVENFITQYELDVPTCPRDLSDFSEERRGSQEDPFPYVACPSTDSTDADGVDSVNDVVVVPELVEEPVCTLGQVCDEGEESCIIAGVEYLTPSMGACGGEACPAAVKQWEESMAEMHLSMMDIRYTGNADIDFVRGMIPHHIAAVDMCRILLEDLTCTELSDIDNLEGLVHFCNHIKREQELEVGGMRAWLQENGLGEVASCDTKVAVARNNHAAMMMSMPESCGNLSTPSSQQFLAVNHKMHELMAVEYSCNHSLDFVRMMMPHHAAAVDMCDTLLDTTQDEYLIGFCNNITMTQRAEVTWMYEWLEARDYEPIAPCNKDCMPEEMMPPCEDTLSTSSFCHGISGTENDGYCRCEDVLSMDGYLCDATAWVDGFGLFMPQELCARSCGTCPSDMRPLWAPGCGTGDHNDHEADMMHQGEEHEGMHHGEEHEGMHGEDGEEGRTPVYVDFSDNHDHDHPHPHEHDEDDMYHEYEMDEIRSAGRDIAPQISAFLVLLGFQLAMAAL